MRYLLMTSLACLILESSPALAHGAHSIGYTAGRDMAARLWNAKYDKDCYRSDNYFTELSRMERGLSGSHYHRGYKEGMAKVETEVAQTCHSTQSNHQGEPQGECPQTGFQHGSNLGMQVCNDTIMNRRMANTCFQQSLATCYDGLKQHVRNYCPNKAYSSSYRSAEVQCQQAFARR
ncbi:MAG TPA: hypothetical protein VE954_07695 [Oligoflexus sp.]|uniref:hypothetical protein n=1 Tax=Oligoflexus sp. TaxID=1971216 RepID=UPI002D349658|nr:hypothetical protein [Oligoflexus sp.]HYX32983.1 hypothetical protein [Oligoflexus sp.]